MGMGQVNVGIGHVNMCCLTREWNSSARGTGQRGHGNGYGSGQHGNGMHRNGNTYRLLWP